MMICDEMQKLRSWLDQNNVSWNDKSDLFICRTHFHIGDKFISVINGLGTYGGRVMGSKYNDGLLEVMIDDNEPMGWQTAEQVIERMKGETE